MRWLAVVVGLGACTSPESSNDVVGPFTGPVHRYVVDHVTLPLTSTEAKLVADDLDGDEHLDNQLGSSLSSLASNDNLTRYGDDMIAVGKIASSVEIQANSLISDRTVSVAYLGRDGEPAVVMGGVIVEGGFTSNRTRDTDVPGRATLHLPVFTDADPSIIVLDGMEIDLVPDGMNGFDATIRGGAMASIVMDEVVRGIRALVAANPAGHPYMKGLFDANVDGAITDEEVRKNSLIVSLLAADVHVPIAGRVPAERVSFGFQVHLKPCEVGSCTTQGPDNLCFDRIKDGDESGVDCGGSCALACPGGQTCNAPTDCQSQTCNAGACAAPSCTDGVNDGFETDVDCGWNCAQCMLGKMCRRNDDCASGRCSDQKCI